MTTGSGKCTKVRTLLEIHRENLLNRKETNLLQIIIFLAATRTRQKLELREYIPIFHWELYYPM